MNRSDAIFRVNIQLKLKCLPKRCTTFNFRLGLSPKAKSYIELGPNTKIDPKKIVWKSVDRIRVAEDRNRWRDLVNTVT
jgi:hypothetical protein